MELIFFNIQIIESQINCVYEYEIFPLKFK